MKLSVIVPVYQVEAYLSACLDSLLDQGISDSEYEIICVDDGSRDHSGRIALDYARQHRQITVIRQENRGLSAARNTGLRYATGEYVYFIDSDDLLERGVLGPLYRLAAEHDLDQLLFDFARFEDGTVPSPSEKGADPERLNLFRDALEMRRQKNVPAWRIACNYLVRLSVLRKYGLTFPEGALFEDAEFNFWLDRCLSSCGYLDQKLYHYRQRRGSILNTYKTNSGFPVYIRGRVRLAERHQTLLRNCRAGVFPVLRVPVTEEELEFRMIDEVQGTLNQMLAKGDGTLFWETLAVLEEKQLYPYPLRWKRLLRNRPLKNRWIDAVSFFYPARWYLRLLLTVRTRLP